MQHIGELAIAATGPLLARTVPISAYVVLSSNRGLLWRVVWLGGLGALFAVLSKLEKLLGFLVVDIALANLWFLLAALVVNLYARLAARMRAMPKLLHLLLLMGVGILVPLRLFPLEMAPLVGPIGWEFWLSSYSYVQVAREKRAFALGDALFFLLVNPMVVFEGHRERTIDLAWRRALGSARILGGYSSLVIGLVIKTILAPELTYLGPLALPIVFLLSQYATHSGRASQDIGLLRMLGYSIPERYHYPLFARSPQEFWQRWNIYVIDWARIYLFLPLARLCKRLGMPGRLAAGLAVLLTFTAIGLMHDVGALWQPALRGYGFSMWFAANGALLVLWRVAERRLASRSGLFAIALSRLLFLATMVFMAAMGLQLITG